MKRMLRAGAGRVRRACARLAQRATGTNRLILLYHRVAEVRPDPWELCVSPARFAEHLEVLRRSGFTCLRLRDLVRLLRAGTLPRRAVAITFDDGYADNLYAAKPLLERYETPATVFLTTGCLGPVREFWWDELERILLQPGALPATLDLVIAGNACRWELGQAARCTDETLSRRRLWRAWQKAPTMRHALYTELWQLLQPLPAGEQRQVLDELAAWAGLTRVVRPTHCILSADEAAALGQENELIEIGAHTVTHPVLPALPSVAQRDEIGRSKADCEAITGRPVVSFSYPFGRSTVETASLAREAGLACACSTVSDVVRRGADGFRLPRVHVPDWDGEEFASRLAQRFLS